MITKWTKTLLKKSSLVMQNNFVFYFVLLIAVLNIAQFCYMNDAKSIGVFIVTGFVVSFFSKNNTVIILISMSIANMFSRVSREGFKKGKKTTKSKGQKTKTSDGNADAAAENKEAEEEKKEAAAEIKEAAAEKKQEMRESQVGTALDMIDRLKEKLDELSKA